MIDIFKIFKNKIQFGLTSRFRVLEVSDSMPVEHRDWAIRNGNFHKTGYTGKGERVAILDTGIDVNHRDLRGQVDGYCFINGCKDKPVYFDNVGHGTFCASEIVAKEDGFGIVGIAPQATAFCGKVIYGDNRDMSVYSFEENLAAAIGAAVKDGCGVISMSLGMAVKSPIIKLAIDEAVAEGVLVFAAAGNEGMEGSPYKSYPAAYENVISVAAANKKGLQQWFSTSGIGENKYEQPEIAIASLEYYWGCLPMNKYGKMIGTCLTGDTLVLTEVGPIKISDIKPGDNVFSYDLDGKTIITSKCTNWFDRGIKNAYRITTNNFKIEATDNHPFLVSEPQIKSSRRKTAKSSRLVWKKLSDLAVGDLVVNYYNLPKEENVVVKGINVTENLCQLVGLFLGDGYIYHDYRRSEKPYGVSFCMFDLCDIYSKFIEDELGVKPHTYNGQLTIYSVQIGEMFSDLELNHNAYTKRIPKWAWKLPTGHKKKLIAGLIDSDGTIDKKGRICFELCNEELINDIKHFCQSTGMHVSNVYKRVRKNPWGNLPSRKHQKQKIDSASFFISVTSYSEIPFLDEKYRFRYNKCMKNSFGKRVYGTECVPSDLELDRIMSIENIGAKNVYDIEVAGTHNFIANGLIVHNSMACPMMAGVALLWRQAMREKGILPIGENVLNEFRNWMQRVATDTNNNGWDSSIGFGVLLLPQDGDLKI